MQEITIIFERLFKKGKDGESGQLSRAKNKKNIS